MTQYFGVRSPEHAATLGGLPALPCPWCYEEQGIAFPRHLSSTICGAHATVMEAQIAEIKAARARMRARPVTGKDTLHDPEEHAE